MFPPAGLTQTTDTASISGQVLDGSHAPMEGVRITVTNTRNGAVRTALTDASGRVSIGSLPVSGVYRLTASKPGFTDASLPESDGSSSNAPGLILSSGTAAAFSLQLNVSSGGTAITVTGVAGEVRSDQPQLGNQLSTRQIAETPLLNRR